MPETTEQASKPLRTWRPMAIWAIALAGLLLLLAWSGANWKTFHLAYCRHLMRSRDGETRNSGIAKVCSTHLRPGMTTEEVRRMFHPLELACQDSGTEAILSVSYPMYVGGAGHQRWIELKFDAQGRLASWSAAGPNMGK